MLSLVTKSYLRSILLFTRLISPYRYITCLGVGVWRPGLKRVNRPSSQQGFTLVEMLIALALVGMMLVILFGSLRLSTRSWEAAEERIQEVEKLRVVEGLLRRQIRESKLLFYDDPEQGRIITFTGTPQAMQFIAPLLTRLGMGGLYWISFEVAEEGGESRLLMRWHPYRPGEQEVERPEGDKQQQQEVLLESVEEVAFSYFGAEATGEEPEWRDYWENPQQSPQLVRLRVHTEDGDWPEFVVGLQSNPLDSGGGGGRRLRVDFGPRRRQ